LRVFRWSFGFVIEYVTDIQAATRFYTHVMGMKVERQHPSFVQFEHFAIATDESLSGTRDPELYWLVEDAESARAALSPQAEVTHELKQMPFGKVFGIKGPTGQPRYLLELAASRPSIPVG
jgi:catechol 2,3-dioxygenase-like lactoylglutathione lyase family enzyme